ncbi:unnamed protein product [Auanema sp. JU1783]|nr:unnamed protein product [Auanema sp. JU1783]
MSLIPPEKCLNDSTIYHVSTANPFKLGILVLESIPHFIIRFRKLHPDYRFPSSFINDLAAIQFTKTEIATLILLSLLLTLIRYLIQTKLQRSALSKRLLPRYSHKFPETVWKLGFYGFAWLMSLYVMMRTPNLNIFHDPLSMWKDWETGLTPPIPKPILAIYTVQASFYLHSVYATLFMDQWRKDSWLMFLHHFIALALLAISYVQRFVLPGALLVFLHDNSDSTLEMAKLGHFMKNRKDGSESKFWNVFGFISFCIFCLLWIVFRLYWYPCKLLYATIYGAVYLGPQDAPLFPVLGIMLVLIFAMNVYWFNFIARMMIRVAITGEEPEDNREWDSRAVSGLDGKDLDKMAADREGKEKAI